MRFPAGGALLAMITIGFIAKDRVVESVIFAVLTFIVVVSEVGKEQQK